MSLGRPRRHLRATDSTNDRARELAEAGAPHGTLVTAAAQSAGRGRQGRAWSAPPGHALLMSLVLREWPYLVPLAAALAVADLAGEGAMVKWPNDVLLDGRKVAGILAEGRPQEGWLVLGIGVNVAVELADLPPELHETAGTLGRDPADVEGALAELLAALERRLGEDAEATLGELRTRDVLRGRPVRWAQGAGTAAGIDDEGRLVVETPDGRIAVGSGEVHLLH